MKVGARLGKVLPRPIRRPLRRLLGWAYYSRAVIGSLLPRGHAALHAGALDCIVARNEHGVYCVPRSSRDKYEGRKIMQSRVWEPETIDLLRDADPDGDIVHAGTFFGDFLPALARSRRNGALVWGFEPNRESYRCAQITTMLNDLGNVVLTHAALDAKGGGTALLATNDRTGLPSGGGSHVVKDPSRASRLDTEEVDLVSVDEVIGRDRSVAVIQLDVERHEQQALAGAMLTIERCRPLIVVERLPEKDWLDANLAPLGYQRDGLVGVNTVLRCR
jgi:FkbM family methyltransferase